MSKIISAGNPILKNVAAPVEVFDKKLKFLVIDMKKTLDSETIIELEC